MNDLSFFNMYWRTILIILIKITCPVVADYQF